jgi:hypothetical protein
MLLPEMEAPCCGSPLLAINLVLALTLSSNPISMALASKSLGQTMKRAYWRHVKALQHSPVGADACNTPASCVAVTLTQLLLQPPSSRLVCACVR